MPPYYEENIIQGSDEPIIILKKILSSLNKLQLGDSANSQKSPSKTQLSNFITQLSVFYAKYTKIDKPKCNVNITDQKSDGTEEDRSLLGETASKNEESFKVKYDELEYFKGDKLEVTDQDKFKKNGKLVAFLRRTGKTGIVDSDALEKPVYALQIRHIVRNRPKLPITGNDLLLQCFNYLKTRWLSDFGLKNLIEFLRANPDSAMLGRLKRNYKKYPSKFRQRYSLISREEQLDILDDIWLIIDIHGESNKKQQMISIQRDLQESSLDEWTLGMINWLVNELEYKTHWTIQRSLKEGSISYTVSLVSRSSMRFVVNVGRSQNSVILYGELLKPGQLYWQSEKIELRYSSEPRFEMVDAVELRCRLLQPCLEEMTRYWVGKSNITDLRNKSDLSTFWSSLRLSKTLVDAIQRSLNSKMVTKYIPYATAPETNVEERLFHGSWSLSPTILLSQLAQEWFGIESVDEKLLEKFPENGRGEVAVAAMVSGQMIVLRELFGAYLLSPNGAREIEDLQLNNSQLIAKLPKSANKRVVLEDCSYLSELPWASGARLEFSLEMVQNGVLAFKCSLQETIQLMVGCGRKAFGWVEMPFELNGNLNTLWLQLLEYVKVTEKNCGIHFNMEIDTESFKTHLDRLARNRSLENWYIKASNCLRPMSDSKAQLRNGDSVVYSPPEHDLVRCLNILTLRGSLAKITSNLKTKPLTFNPDISSLQLVKYDTDELTVQLPYYNGTFLHFTLFNSAASDLYVVFLNCTKQLIGQFRVNHLDCKDDQWRVTLDEALTSRVTDYFHLWDSDVLPLNLVEILFDNIDSKNASLLLRAWPVMRYEQSCGLLFIDQNWTGLQLDFHLDMDNCFKLLHHALQRDDLMVIEFSARFIHDAFCFGQIDFEELCGPNGKIVVDLLKRGRLYNTTMELQFFQFFYLALDGFRNENSTFVLQDICRGQEGFLRLCNSIDVSFEEFFRLFFLSGQDWQILSDPNLKYSNEMVMRFSEKQFREIFLPSLPSNFLEIFLRRDDLHCYSEEAVLKLMNRNYNKWNPKLFKRLVRFNHIDNSLLSNGPLKNVTKNQNLATVDWRQRSMFAGQFSPERPTFPTLFTCRHVFQLDYADDGMPYWRKGPLIRKRHFCNEVVSVRDNNVVVNMELRLYLFEARGSSFSEISPISFYLENLTSIDSDYFVAADRCKATVFDASGSATADLPVFLDEKYGSSLSVVDGKLISIGGVKSSGFVETLDISGSADNWIQSHKKCDNGSFHRSLALDEKIYVIGGKNFNYVQILDMRDRSPLPTIQMKFTRMKFGCVEWNRQIWCCGGVSGSTGRANVEVFDPRYNVFFDGPDLPFDAGKMAAARAAKINFFV